MNIHLNLINCIKNDRALEFHYPCQYVYCNEKTMDWFHSLWKGPSYIHRTQVHLVSKEHVSHVSASNILSAFCVHAAQFPFVGAFSKFWKATISIIMFVHVFVFQHGITRLLVDGFSWSFIFKYFSKICRKIQVSLKSENYNGYFLCFADRASQYIYLNK
jgi:hypothetical protein